jgi:integrase
MILLGINCGFGNADCGKLPLSAVDLDKGIIDFPRPKTGIARRCPLWPETVAAIRAALAIRPRPKTKEVAPLVFVTKYGRSWARTDPNSPMTRIMIELATALGITGRKGLGFYTLRHTFRTIADESKDQPAVDFIMGHVDASMAGHYRERIDDSRLLAVVEHVRSWLFGD